MTIRGMPARHAADTSAIIIRMMLAILRDRRDPAGGVRRPSRQEFRADAIWRRV
jgi:hypothetical protein